MLQTIRNISVQVRGVSSVGLPISDLPFHITSKILGASNFFFGTRKTCPWAISKFDKSYGQSLIMSSINCVEDIDDDSPCKYFEAVGSPLLVHFDEWRQMAYGYTKKCVSPEVFLNNALWHR
jgi:hypothetical protein